MFIVFYIHHFHIIFPSESSLVPKRMIYMHIGGQCINAGDLVLVNPVFEFTSKSHNTRPETAFVNPNLRIAKIDYFSIHSTNLSDFKLPLSMHLQYHC